MNPRVLIVGGGPAGAACGITLARHGAQVQLLERGSIGREKVCGDGLNVDAQKALERLDVFQRIRRSAYRVPKAIIYGYGGEAIPIDETFYTLQRAELDQILRDEVSGSGGSVAYDVRIATVGTGPAGVWAIDSAGERWEADVLVLATGHRVDLAQQLGFSFSSRSAVALRGYAPNTAGLDAYTFWMHRDIYPGYAWAFPCPGNTINLGVICFDSRRRANLRELLATFVERLLPAALGPIQYSSAPKGCPLRTGLRRRPSIDDRVLLVGENVSCTYDLIGEGIGKALESGILAGETIAASEAPFRKPNLETYHRRLLDTSDAFHQGYSRVMKIMGHPVGSRLFTRLLTCSPRMQHALRSVVREEMTPQELFSAKGVIRTLSA